MDIRAYYGLNNYFEPILANWRDAYPNNINIKKKTKKSIKLNIFNWIFQTIMRFFRVLIGGLLYSTKKRSRDYYFDQALYE